MSAGHLPINFDSAHEGDSSCAETVLFSGEEGESPLAPEFANLSDDEFGPVVKKLRFAIDGTPLVAIPRKGLLAPRRKQVGAVTPTPKSRGGRAVRGLKKDQGVSRRLSKICGPASIKTLRGRILGREVSLVLCGETHEDAIDLTRRGSVMKPDEGWGEEHVTPGAPGLDPRLAIATKGNISIAAAKRWGEDVLLDHLEDEGSTLVFEPCESVPGQGTAMVFLPGAERRPETPFSARASVFRWEEDGDDEARAFNRSRSQQDMRMRMTPEEQDKLISSRKARIAREGVQLFDDWLLRQAMNPNLCVHLVLEAPVSATEVELHVEEGVAPAPIAHECLQQLEPDSDEDTEEHGHGGGSFLDYIRRRASLHMQQDRVHCIDPRVLGDAEDECLPHGLRGSFQRIARALPKDSEQHVLASMAQSSARPADDEHDDHLHLPSWEAFFGGAADLLYYAHHVRADFSPFLSKCVGSPETLRRFFDALYFGTVPEALKQISLDEETRPYAHIRSLLYQSPETKDVQMRVNKNCHSGRRTCTIRAAPVDCYLKAKGSNPPRTWLAGIAARVRDAGADCLVDAASKWYRNSVDKLLKDPKYGDLEGDNFAAWLRACHREVYNDIDTHDPCKLRRQHWAESERAKHERELAGKNKDKEKKSKDYNLKAITIPGVDNAFKEFHAVEGVSTRREQVLSKIVVDSYALRSVDLAMALQTVDAVLSSPEDTPVVVVLYAGLDHTRNVVKFFRSQGFSPAGLPNNGLVGKDTPYKEEERRSLKLPAYLDSVERLFPVPKSAPEVVPGFKRKPATKVEGAKRLAARKEKARNVPKSDRTRITRKSRPVQLPTIGLI